MTIGECVRDYRTKNKLSLEELAAKLNCSPSALSYIENDWIKRITFVKFIELVVFLNLSAEDTQNIIMTYYNSEVKNG